MEWETYRELIASAEYRSNVPNVFADPDHFAAAIDDMREATDVDPEYVAGIDALGFIPGAALARDFDAGFISIRKGGKLPIAERYRLADDCVDWTGREKTLELDRRMVPDGERVLVVDDYVETASQVRVAVDLLEEAGAEVCGLTFLCALQTEETRSLDAEYGVYSVNPWDEA
ncbi:phosphoribosyltransferase family protein [Haloparvum sp. AD34]